MYKQTYLCEIVEKKQLAPEIIDMTIKSKELAADALPGQFLNIRCGDGCSTILRRPISICDVDPAADTLRFIFQVKGSGTQFLEAKQCGDTLDIMGPLGSPFHLLEKVDGDVILLGGGIGVFPLFLLAKSIYEKGVKPTAYLGFRSADLVVMEAEFKQYTKDVKVSTDDGSYGMHGYATAYLINHIKNKKVGLVYACGPEPMLRQVQSICHENKVRCQLSLEQRMGCGIGACLVCACKIKKQEGFAYQHVCKDGPVFWSEDVVFGGE